MPDFIDPRTHPQPPCRVSRDPATSGQLLRDLARLCASGRVYDVEEWIRGGQPIQARDYPKGASFERPLRAAIRNGRRDIVLLLLCNGYRLDLEPVGWASPLNEALSARDLDIVELLLTWGADPKTAAAHNVIDTYKTELIDKFWQLGLDYTQDPEFINYLSGTANKPLYGWLRRHRSDQRIQDAIDVALVEAVQANAERCLHLLLWAGANPHRRVPSVQDYARPEAWGDEDLLCSAAEAAITFGQHKAFRVLKVATMPNLVGQLPHAHDASTLRQLVGLQSPGDWSDVILACIRRLSWPFHSSWDAREALGFIASQGGRLTAVSASDLRYLRRELLDLGNSDDFLWVLWWLGRGKHCAPEIAREITRTDGMRRKIAALGAGERYLTPAAKMKRAADRRRRAVERQKQDT